MKSKVTINVDSFIYEEAKERKYNISATTEQALRARIEVDSGNLDDAAERVIRKKLERSERNLTQIQAKCSEYRNILAKIEEKREKSEIIRLEKQQDAVNNAKRCINCRLIQAESIKMHDFPVGQVCHGCLMGAAKDQLMKWGKK